MVGKNIGTNEGMKRLEAARRSNVPMKIFSVLVLDVDDLCAVLTGEDIGLELLGPKPS